MEGKSNGVDVMDWDRIPPPQRPFCERFAKAIYDPEEKSFMGRTPKRWGIILAFYFVFYLVLGLMFSLCMGGLFMTLDDHTPKFLMSQSLIGSNPGVAHRPRPLNDLASIYSYSMDNASHTDVYVRQLADFFKAYENQSWYKEQKECTIDDNFGFPEKPCFFIKLNKIYGWVPQTYGATELPPEMEEDLKSHILSLDPLAQQKIWISCEEEKNNVSKIEYPWSRGLPGHLYPFQNQPGYASPLVAVRITPQRNTASTVKCRAWAKNIIYSRSIKEPLGCTRFQIMIEDHTQTN